MKQALSKLFAVLFAATAVGLVTAACDDSAEQPPIVTMYTVTYDLDGGNGTLPTETDKTAGATFALASSDGLAKDGFTFDKWNDGTADYAAGAQYTMPAKDVTFTAVWKSDDQPPVTTLYKVTYDLDGGKGTLPTETDKAAGATFALASSDGLTKDGFTFNKWNDGTADYAAGAQYTMPAKAVTLTAVWKSDEVLTKMHTVKFDPKNSTESDEEDGSWEVQVEDGKPVAKPQTDPVHPDGKHFRYWIDENGEYNFSTPVTRDIELNARYAWKVTYIAGDGATGSVEPEWLNNWGMFGITLNDGSGLSNGDKVFVGWNDGKTTYAGGEMYRGTGNVTFTAVWEDPSDGFTVSYETQFRGEGTPPPSVEMQEGEILTLPANTFTVKPDYAGYVFVGWYVKGESSTVLYQPGDTYAVPAKNVTFVAKWDRVNTNYTVTYKPGDHATGAPVTQSKSGSIEIAYGVSFDSWTVENNYVINGWKVEGDASGTVYEPYAGYVLTGNVTFVAQWVRTVMVYDAGGEEYGMIQLFLGSTDGYLYDADYNPYEFTYALDGTKITVTIDGADFVGTFDGTDLAIKLTYKNVNYFFGVDVEYPVKFVAGTGAAGTPPAAQMRKASETFALPTADGLSKTGYVFDGWKTGTSPVYAAGADYTMPKTPNRSWGITFTAQWREEGEAPAPVAPTVTFDANGGSGSAPSATVTATTDGYYKVTLPVCTFTPPTGKKFLAWEYGGAQYAQGDDTITLAAGASITVKALWTNDASQSEDEIVGTAYFGSLTLEESINSNFGDYVEYVKFTVSDDMSAATFYYYEKSDWNVYADGATLKHKTISFDAYESSNNTFDPNGVVKYVRLGNNSGHFIYFNAAKTQFKVCNSSGSDYTSSEIRGSALFSKGDASAGYVEFTAKDLADLSAADKRYDFENSFVVEGFTFVGMMFSKNTLNSGIKIIYLDKTTGNEKIGSLLPILNHDENNGYLIKFKSSSGSTYQVTFGKKADGTYYITAFAYKNVSPDTLPIKLVEHAA